MDRRRWIGVAALLVALAGCDEPLDTELIVTDDEQPAAAIEDPVLERPEEDDGAIADAVRTELWMEDAIAPGAVEVSVGSGVVTLRGAVGSVVAERRALERAENVLGVRAVIDRMQVEPTDRSDAAIRADVTEALERDPATEAYEVEVAVDDGVLSLSGAVDGWHEKMLTEHVAGAVRGVTAVENRIRIDATQDRPDAEVRHDVQSRLAHDVRIDAALIDVAVDDGAVALSGTVGSVVERNQAIADAWVAGVRDVEAEALSIEPFARDRMRRDPAVYPDDEAIERAVRDAWLQDPRVSSFELIPTVDDGMAILTGTVDNPSARWAAEQDAHNTVGVWRVRNFIRVDPEDGLDDGQLGRLVREAFERSPHLERSELEVTMRDGWARLRGVVDSEFERDEAVRIAGALRGVAGVRDALEVTPDDGSPRADWMLEQDVESQLFWNPRIDADEVDVLVEEGVVTLEGTVDDWAAHGAAVAEAREAGAASVVAHLRVRHGPPALRAEPETAEEQG